MVMVTLMVPDADFDMLEMEFPGRYEVCPRCEGEGSHVNPNVDGHGISQEEFDEDPEFREMYFGGVFDVTCEKCKGKRVVGVPDEDACDEEQKGFLNRLRELEEDRAEMEAMYRSERMMGA